MKIYCVYIMTNKYRGTLYVGITCNLQRRVLEHRSGLFEGFTELYALHCLVYVKMFGTARDAIMYEKRLKKWNRAWKIRLIEETNMGWADLYEQIFLGIEPMQD